MGSDEAVTFYQVEFRIDGGYQEGMLARFKYSCDRVGLITLGSTGGNCPLSDSSCKPEKAVTDSNFVFYGGIDKTCADGNIWLKVEDWYSKNDFITLWANDKAQLEPGQSATLTGTYADWKVVARGS